MSVATCWSDTKEASFDTTLEWAPDGLAKEIGWQGETQLGFVALAGGVEP